VKHLEPRDDVDEEVLFERLPATAARDELIQRYRALAGYLARRFAGRGEPIEDLEQVAMIGLLNAVNRFDPDRQVRFSTYASATIIGELKRHFRDKGWAVRVPRRAQELSVRLNRTLPQLVGALGRSPTVPEIAAHLGVETDEVIEAMEAGQAYSATPLEGAADESGRAPLDTLGDEDPSMEIAEEWSVIAPALRQLPERERRILYLRFFEGQTQSEIAATIGVSQMHISRILARTLTSLRAQLNDPSNP
jgi:RNA polymerase sigma-B factor